MKENEKWVSMEEICAHLDCSRDTVKKMIKNQNMPAYKIDRKWKFKISEVDTWMHNHNRVTQQGNEVNDNAKNH